MAELVTQEDLEKAANYVKGNTDYIERRVVYNIVSRLGDLMSDNAVMIAKLDGIRAVVKHMTKDYLDG